MPDQKFYITTAIDYINGKPHIGHSYEKVAADVLARFHRLKGDDTRFLTGTDEHGAKIAKYAEDSRLSIGEFADEAAAKFQSRVGWVERIL
jgi:methionyl-tRNA synthetase